MDVILLVPWWYPFPLLIILAVGVIAWIVYFFVDNDRGE